MIRRELTSTIFLFADDRTLLLYHHKMGRWMPPGGHLEEGELPPAGAIREAREETGLEVELLGRPQMNFLFANSRTFPTPYLCLLEELPDHQHIDSIYIGRPVGGTLKENPAESGGIRWFTEAEVRALCVEQEVLPDVQQIIYSVFDDLREGRLQPVDFFLDQEYAPSL